MFPIRELIRRAARNLLAHRDVGRSIDPISEQWAESVLKANPSEAANVQPAPKNTQPEVS